MKKVTLKVKRHCGTDDRDPYWTKYCFDAELTADGTIRLGTNCQWTEYEPWAFRERPRAIENQMWRVRSLLERADEGSYEDETIAKRAIEAALRTGESDTLRCVLEDDPEGGEYHNGYDIYVTAHATAR